jgi:hypothetical protein
MRDPQWHYFTINVQNCQDVLRLIFAFTYLIPFFRGGFFSAIPFAYFLRVPSIIRVD